VTTTVAPLKPRLRGWLHLGTLPFALVAGLWLTANGTTYKDRLAVALFALTSCLLFATSAVYHIGTWTPKVHDTLKRLDHSSIALIIAGTYTPIAIAILPSGQATDLLSIVWATTIIIVGFRVAWPSTWPRAPRWAFTGLYLALGWAAVFWMPALWHYGGAVNFALIAAGGLLYSVGATFYALKRPSLSPSWFGYHELFHACTVAAFACHLVVIARTAA
jgi:hemolysin III